MDLILLTGSKGDALKCARRVRVRDDAHQPRPQHINSVGGSMITPLHHHQRYIINLELVAMGGLEPPTSAL